MGTITPYTWLGGLNFKFKYDACKAVISTGYPILKIYEFIVVIKTVGAPPAFSGQGPGMQITGQPPTIKNCPVSVLYYKHYIYLAVFKSPNCPRMRLSRC